MTMIVLVRCGDEKTVRERKREKKKSAVGTFFTTGDGSHNFGNVAPFGRSGRCGWLLVGGRPHVDHLVFVGLIVVVLLLPIWPPQETNHRRCGGKRLWCFDRCLQHEAPHGSSRRGRRVGLCVTKIIDQQHVISKPIEGARILGRAGAFSSGTDGVIASATQREDGGVSLLIDVEWIIKAAEAHQGSAAA